MKRFIEGEDRRQAILLPESLEDYVAEDNPVRVIDVFIDELEAPVRCSCWGEATSMPVLGRIDATAAWRQAWHRGPGNRELRDWSELYQR